MSDTNKRINKNKYSTYMRYLENTNSQRQQVEYRLPVEHWLRGVRNRELVFNRYRVSVWDDEEVLGKG